MLIVSVVVAMMLMEGGLSSKIGYGAIEHGGEQKPCKGPKCLPGSSNGYNRVHFWAPTFKWGISIANVADFSKPPEKLSYPQQIAVACTGIVWSRYSTVITPKNWNLFSVNVAMAGTGLYQLYRKVQHDYSSEPEAVIAKE
uniref:Mitochondrial pyruvate carrier n=1 Tax=Cannabis sativa TaxID=3483 RepID=A0A803NYU1_CANSA